MGDAGQRLGLSGAPTIASCRPGEVTSTNTGMRRLVVENDAPFFARFRTGTARQQRPESDPARPYIAAICSGTGMPR